MIVEHFLTTKDETSWRTYLPGQKSAFGSLGYAQVAELFQGRVARLYVVKSEEGWISQPMLLRPISALPFAGSSTAQWDAGSPEYTGPQVFGQGEELAQEYAPRRRGLAAREGIVTEFAHLDPWSNGTRLLHDGRFYDRDIVWINTELEPEHLWTHHLQHRARKSINKATREGLRTLPVHTDQEICQYARIYQGTMERAGALSSYHYSSEYFLAIRDRMEGNALFFLTLLGDTVVGGLLLIYDDDNVYAHLGGSDAAFHHLSPAAFQIWHAIQWACKSGRKRVVLGGGYKGNDGIFQFKSSFSPLRQPFYVYKKIHLGDEYQRLELKSRAYHKLQDEEIEYFPSYRYARS